MNTKTTATIDIPKDKPILLFDGVCNLCNASVQFIIKRDPKAKVRYAALQSEIGQAILEKENRASNDLDTAILYEHGQIYTRSCVGLRLSRYMSGLWPLFYVFIFLPKALRDPIYNWIAKNRYNWFGKSESCMLPTPELKSRFL